jgi:hypothetical protein
VTEVCISRAHGTVRFTDQIIKVHKKHGLGAILDKIVHPHGHGHGEEHHHHKEYKDKQKEGDAAAAPFNAHVEVAVPETASDGGAHLAPAGNAVGGIF